MHRHQMVIVVTPSGTCKGMIAHIGRNARTRFFAYSAERAHALANVVSALSHPSAPNTLTVQPWVADKRVGWSAQRMRPPVSR